MTADISYLQNLQQPLGELQRQFDAQRAAYAAHPMPPAAQRQQWLKALKDFKSGRTSSLMHGLAASLSDQDMEDLAAYYASLK